MADVNSPLVSVIITVWNGERYLGAAIESALAQTYRPIEIVVVDDGSTDGSADVARSFPDVVLVRQPNMGIGAARNTGVASSTGSYLSFLDADDEFAPDKTERQLAALWTPPYPDVVFGHAEEFWSPELTPDERPNARIATTPVPVRLLNSAIVLRETFDAIGPFSASPAGQGIEWYLRFQESAYRELMLDDVAYRRRLHQSNQGVSRRHLQTTRLEVLKAALDRRRAL